MQFVRGSGRSHDIRTFQDSRTILFSRDLHGDRPPQLVPRSMERLPFECLVEVFSNLDELSDLANAAKTCAAFRDATLSDYIWRNMCVKAQHGERLDFNENVLGTFSHPDAQSTPRKSTRKVSSHSPASGESWRDVYRATSYSRASTICIDTGRGYAKYGLASSPHPRSIQICMPDAEADQQSLYSLALVRLGFRNKKTVQNLSAIVSEPFVFASQTPTATRARKEWRQAIERRLLSFEIRRLAIVDSASLCLFANKLTTGVVLNIGFGYSYVVPVIAGHIIRSAVQAIDFSGMGLTQAMAQMLHREGVDLEWQPEMGGPPLASITVARNIKELAAEVLPVRPKCTHEIFSSMPATKTVTLGEVTLEIGAARFLCPEVLFGFGQSDENSLQHGVVNAVNEAARIIEATTNSELAGDEDVAAAAEALGRLAGDEETTRRKLLGSVVLSGGTAGIPGLYTRLQTEICHLLAANNSDPATIESVTVHEPFQNDEAQWRGAAALAGTSTFAAHWCVHRTAPSSKEDSLIDSCSEVASTCLVS